MTTPSLTIDLCGIKLANPTVLPSGFLGTSKSLLKRVADNGAGAATIKSVSFEAREGHKNPTVIPFEAGLLNAVGYSATKLPIFVKLSPNIPEIGNLAKAAEDAGANAITAVNTLGPGMIINIEARNPVLAYRVGGVSGQALRPIATRCVYDIYEAVKIPIIGTGGISTGRHAIEMIMAGATAIGVGTGIYERGIDIFRKICREMEAWMSENNFNTVDEMIGIAHE